MKRSKDSNVRLSACATRMPDEMVDNANAFKTSCGFDLVTLVNVNKEEQKLTISAMTMEGVRITDVINIPKSVKVRTLVDKIELSAVKKMSRKDRYDMDTDLPDGDIKHTPSGTLQKVTVSFDHELSTNEKVRILRENYVSALSYFLKRSKSEKADIELINMI